MNMYVVSFNFEGSDRRYYFVDYKILDVEMCVNILCGMRFEYKKDAVKFAKKLRKTKEHTAVANVKVEEIPYDVWKRRISSICGIKEVPHAEVRQV